MRLLGVLLCLLLAGCAAAPVAPVQAGHQPTEVDEAGFWQAMEREEQKLRDSAARIVDPQLERYLQELTCKLAEDLCGDVRVYVLRSPYFNAFMAPNGMMVLFSGVLLRCADEAQLAFVIAHEIGHYRLRHSLSNWRRTKNTANVLTALGMLSGAGNVGGAAYMVSMLGAYADLARFSREQEAQADAVAAQQLLRAGYDLQPAVELWRGALAEERANPRGSASAIFASHPPSPQRIEALLQQVASAADAGQGASPQRGEAPWLAQLAPFRGNWLDDELSRRNHAQTAVLLERLALAATPSAQLAYAQGELYRQRAGSGDLERALQRYQYALQQVDCPPEAARQLGLVLRRLGRVEESIPAFADYLRRAPDATDRALIQSYLQ